MKVAIVIPAYNEAATIEEVVASVRPHGLPIVVDDCSTDSTADLAAAAGAEVVRHRRNMGYDGALQSGFRRADELAAALTVTFDADGQHDAGVLQRVLAPLLAGEADLVLGVRPRPARLSEWAFGLYTRLRYRVPDILCGLKAYDMRLYRRHGCFGSSRSIGTELALASLARGARWATVPVPIRPRQGRPRFGSLLRANGRILRAMLLAMRADLCDWPRRLAA